METNSPGAGLDRRYRLRLLCFSTVGIFTAEVLVMLLVEGWLGHLPVVLRVFLDATLLMICVFPTLYFLVFQEMTDQIRKQVKSEQVLEELNRTLGQQVEERTARLQRANEDLLVEVRERARIGMILNQTLKEANAERVNLQEIINGLSDGLLVVDAGGVIRLANQAGAARLGTNADELCGRPLAERLATAFPAGELETFITDAAEGSSLRCLWPAAGSKVPVAIELELGAACKWDGEPAVILILRGER